MMELKKEEAKTFFTLRKKGAIALGLIVLTVFVWLKSPAEAALSEQDCRSCHNNPAIITTFAKDAHHILVGQPCTDSNIVNSDTWQFSTCVVSGNTYQCTNCHGMVWDPIQNVYKLVAPRNCLECHLAATITSAAIADGRITINGTGFAEVTESNKVYVKKAGDPSATCATTVVEWTDQKIVADSEMDLEGKYCAQPDDTVVVPCAIAEFAGIETTLSSYYFPSIKDDDAIGWENYLSVQAKDPVAMDVIIRVYDMLGGLQGKYVYSDTIAGANAAAVAPNARVAQRPSWLVGSSAAPVAIEGSVIVETSVPAIASTNCIANFYKGFSIYEAAKVRQIHNFPKAYDGPDNFQVYMLAQNIYPSAISVTVRLFGKTPAEPGHGATKTYSIPAYGTLKVRPSEVAPTDPVTGKAINFSGSVVVYSDQASAGDGLGPAIPAMCRYEAGAEALAIYESTVEQPALTFPVIKDGRFGGALDYQNFVSVVNPSVSTSATITMVLYNLAGVEEGRLTDSTIAAGGKNTWRPSYIKGSLALPKDFEGSIVVYSDIPVVGQTNTIYPGSNQYGADGFDLFESAIPASSLFFPKVYDNLLGSGTGATHLTDNFVYIQNVDETGRNITIDLYNSNGSLNRTMQVAIPSHATHVFRPKDLVTDGSGVFRGSVKIIEAAGLAVAGAIKYEVHRGTAATSVIEAMTIYRSMGQ